MLINVLMVYSSKWWVIRMHGPYPESWNMDRLSHVSDDRRARHEANNTSLQSVKVRPHDLYSVQRGVVLPRLSRSRRQILLSPHYSVPSFVPSSFPRPSSSVSPRRPQSSVSIFVSYLPFFLLFSAYTTPAAAKDPSASAAP